MSAPLTLLEPARRARALERHPADSGAAMHTNRIELAIQSVAIALILNTIMLTFLALSMNLHVTSTSPWWSYMAPIVSAVGTTGAFAVTYRLFFHSRLDRLRAQADRVFIQQRRTLRVDHGLEITATVFNKSSAPIWSVEVKPLRAGAPYERDGVTQPLPDIWPNEEYVWSWSVNAEDAAGEDRHPRLVFIDGSGHRWEKVGSAARLMPTRRRWQAIRRRA